MPDFIQHSFIDFQSTDYNFKKIDYNYNYSIYINIK